MPEITAEFLADEMYKIVQEVDGKKLLKPGDLAKMMKAKFGPEADRKLSKAALRIITTDGRCVYEYAGGSYVKLKKD